MRKNIKNAKKIVLLFSSVLMLGSLAFTGCKGKDKDQKAASDQTKQTQNAVPSTTTDKENKTASNDSVLSGGADSSLEANKDKAGNATLSDSKNTSKPIDDKNSFDIKKDDKKADKKDDKKDNKKDNKKDDKKKEQKKPDAKKAEDAAKLTNEAKKSTEKAANKANEAANNANEAAKSAS